MQPWKCPSRFFIMERLFTPLCFYCPNDISCWWGWFFLTESNKRVLFTFILKVWDLDLLENYLWDLRISFLHRSSHLYLLLYIWPQSSKSLRHVNNFQHGSSPPWGSGTTTTLNIHIKWWAWLHPRVFPSAAISPHTHPAGEGACSSGSFPVA